MAIEILIAGEAELGSALGGITAGMAGQSLGEAWEDQGMHIDAGISFGYNNHVSDTPAVTGDTSGTISNSSQSDPIDAFDEYDGQVDAVSGGAVIGSNATTFNYSLLEDSNGDVSAVAPTAVPLNQAVVAISQLLGVSMSIGQISPQLRNKFILALTEAGAVYSVVDDLVTAWWDGVNVLFRKNDIEAIESVLEEEGIGQGGTEYPEYQNTGDVMITSIMSSVDAINEVMGNLARNITNFNSIYTSMLNVASNYPYCLRFDRLTSDNGQYWGGVNLAVFTFLDSSSIVGTTVTLGTNYGRTVHGYRLSATGTVSNSSGNWGYLNSPVKTLFLGQLFNSGVNILQYSGLNVSTTSGYFPEGTEASQADSYTPDSVPIAGGIATSDSTTDPVVAINLPSNPDSSIGSTTDPNAGTSDDTTRQLPPAPLPVPVPNTNVSNPNVPLVDSSVVNSELIDQLVEELANTLDPQPEQSSGLIAIPNLPGGTGGYPSIIPSSGPGLIHVYNPTPGEFVSFGNWLWVTYADTTIQKIWANPFDGVIGAFELYATPQTDGTDNIRSGFLTCPTTAALVRQRYIEIDCGTIVVPEFYGNYLDYSPYSQCYIYLPFIGINEVSIDDIVGHAVNIRYRVDCYNGSCIAMIIVAKNGYRNLCYQFAGNCGVEVPLAGGSQAAIKAGMMQAEAYARSGMGSAMGSIITGLGSLLLGSIGGLMSGVGSAISSSLNAQAGMEAARVANKATVQHSGQFGSSHGAMGAKKPFIIIRNPIQVKVVNYNDDYGYPAHKRVIIGGCTGYLRVREVNVISAHATDNEKKMIEALLKNGVYVS